MKFKIIILLALLSVSAKAQINVKLLRFIPIDTVATPPTFPALAPSGIYYNVSTGRLTYKDNTGYHKFGTGSGGGGGSDVLGTANRITATGTTTKTIDISATFEALLGKVANPLSQFASTTSAQLAGVISNETGTGSLVYSASPVLTTPNLGTPSALTLTNATGLPITGLSTFSSGLLAAQLTNESGTGLVAYTTSPVFTTPDLGTPSDVILTNGTGLPITGITSSTSTQLATLLTNETGTGQAVFSVSPAFTTPNLGVPSAVTLTNGTGLPITGVTSSTSAQLSTLLSDEVGTGALYMGQPIEATATSSTSLTLTTAHVSVYSHSGLIRFTNTTAINLTVPTNATAALPLKSKIALDNQGTDTVTVVWAGGVAHNDGGYVEIPPHSFAMLYKYATDGWDLGGTGPGGSGSSSGGNCYTEITGYTTNHTLDETDITDCNNNGFIRFTHTSDIVFTVPLASTLPVSPGTFIALSNQSADDTITVVFTSGITGGNHSYDEILPGEIAMITNISTDVWDINGTRPAIGGGGGGSGDALTTSPLSQFAATTSAQLRGVLTDEVGTGAFYTVGGALGTPASGTATNLTGLPITGITSSTSAQVATLVSDETGTGSVVLATSPTLVTPNLGTPSAVNLTNATALPASAITGAFSSWTPTITGFSANPTMECRYLVIGKAFFFWVTTTANGTSNATSFTITFPFTSSTITSQIGALSQYTTTGSVVGTTQGKWYVTSNSNVINLAINSGSTGNTSWTASGTKGASFQGMIEIQ